NDPADSRPPGAVQGHLFQFSLRSRCTAMLTGLRTLIQAGRANDCRKPHGYWLCAAHYETRPLAADWPASGEAFDVPPSAWGFAGGYDPLHEGRPLRLCGWVKVSGGPDPHTHGSSTI